jgi:hypothetical protein
MLCPPMRRGPVRRCHAAPQARRCLKKEDDVESLVVQMLNLIARMLKYILKNVE